MAFTDYGSHGILDTPSGSVLLRPEQYATFGVAPPPVVDEPPPPPGVAPVNSEPPPLATPSFTPPPVDPATQVSRPDDGFGVTPGPGAVSTPPPPQSTDPALVSSAAPAAPTPLPVAQEADALPAPAPLPTNLSKTTYGDVLAEQQAAINQGTQAGVAALAAETKNNDATARALEQRNAEIAAKQQEFAQREVEDQKRLADTTKLFEAKVKEFADKKVDRANYGVSPMQAIGVALSGIGSAYKGQGDKNPALDLLLSQIDKYVDDQYRAKEALGQEAGLIKSQLGVFQDAASNTQAQKQLAVAGILDRSVRDMEAMAPRMQNQQAAARLLGLAAAARAKGAELFGGAVQLQHGEDQAKAQRDQQERESRRAAATAAANRRENARQFDLSLADQIAAREQNKAAAVAAAQTEADRDAAKREVADLKAVTVGPDGKPVEVAYRAKNEKLGDDVATVHAAVTTVDNLMAEAIRIRNTVGSGKKYSTFAALKKSPEYQKLLANVNAAGVAWAKSNHMGAWDNGTQLAVLNAQGGDPMRAGFFADTIGRYVQGDPNVGLEQFRKNTVDNFNNFANSVRDPRGGAYVPIKPVETNFVEPAVTERVKTLLRADTPASRERDAVPGSTELAMNLRFPGNYPGNEAPTKRQDEAASWAVANQADWSGRLTKESKAIVDGILADMKSPDPKVAEQARIDLVAVATSPDSAKKPELRAAMIDALQRAGAERELAQVQGALQGEAANEPPVDASGGALARAGADRPGRVLKTIADFEREAAEERRAVNDPSKRERPSVEVLADQATRGDREAATLLADMALGKPIGKFGKPSTDDQFKALMAVQAIARARGGR